MPRSKPKLREQRSDLQLAELLVERHGEDLRYCAQLGGWHVWAGTHWELDERERHREAVKSIARELADEAASLLHKPTFDDATRAGSARGLTAILSMARSTPGIVFGAAAADRDPWLLSCANGTVDLRTGNLREHRRDDLITRSSPVPFDPDATSPTFERFLRAGRDEPP